MNTKAILDFLQELAQNNNREWFQRNKPRYEKLRGELESFINKLIPEIHKFDPFIGMVTAKDCIFRIYRDIRFSADKLPYKTNMGAYISEGGRKGGRAGYYIHLAPDESFLGGGLYMPPADVLKLIRQEVYFNSDDLKRIMAVPDFQRVYGGIHDMDDKLKKPPRDFPADFKDIGLLKHKSYTVWHTLTPAELNSSALLDDITEKFRIMYPFNAFMNRIFE